MMKPVSEIFGLVKELLEHVLQVIYLLRYMDTQYGMKTYFVDFAVKTS